MSCYAFSIEPARIALTIQSSYKTIRLEVWKYASFVSLEADN